MKKVVGTTVTAVALAAMLAGCAHHRKHVARAPAPKTTKARQSHAVAMPVGGRPGMAIPARLANGSYRTPNHAVSGPIAVWHLRAGLNVAALACRGGEQAAIVKRYNALLSRQKTSFSQAQSALASQYRAGGGNWQARQDDAMTRLYNYFSQDFARAAFCARAAQVLERADGVAPAAFPGFASKELAALDQPFVEFFRAYDAWRTQGKSQSH